MKKLCKTCNTEKSIDDFYTAVSNKDQKQSYCKKCNKQKKIERRKVRGYCIEYHKEKYYLYYNTKLLYSAKSKAACELVKSKHKLKQITDKLEKAKLDADTYYSTL